MSKNIAILGAGGFARECYYHIFDRDPDRSGYIDKVVFVDDVTDTTEIVLDRKVCPVIKDWKFDKDYTFVVGIGSPKGKEIMVQKAFDAGLKPERAIISKHATILGQCDFGYGSVITAGCVLTTNVKIGNYTILNLNTTVGHDAKIGDYVTCNPGVSISGGVTLGKRSFIGVGATILEGLTIGDDVIIGAQACVTKDLLKPGTYIGVPARELIKKEK
jgi:sugar O-acyltransferase (sialic acid O-acetyltransferase NeuD family)